MDKLDETDRGNGGFGSTGVQTLDTGLITFSWVLRGTKGLRLIQPGAHGISIVRQPWAAPLGVCVPKIVPDPMAGRNLVHR